MDQVHHKYGCGCGCTKQPRLTAAIPSRLAERLAEVALNNKDDVHTACQNYLKEHWARHGKLCDLLLDEEAEIRKDMRKATCYPVSDLLSQDARKMPMVYKYWDPINTTVSATESGMAVIFKDDKIQPLIRVWVEYDLRA